MFSLLHCINSACNFKMINIILFILNNLYDIYISQHIRNYKKLLGQKHWKEDSKL